MRDPGSSDILHHMSNSETNNSTGNTVDERLLRHGFKASRIMDGPLRRELTRVACAWWLYGAVYAPWSRENGVTAVPFGVFLGEALDGLRAASGHRSSAFLPVWLRRAENGSWSWYHRENTNDFTLPYVAGVLADSGQEWMRDFASDLAEQFARSADGNGRPVLEPLPGDASPTYSDTAIETACAWMRTGCALDYFFTPEGAECFFHVVVPSTTSFNGDAVVFEGMRPTPAHRGDVDPALGFLGTMPMADDEDHFTRVRLVGACVGRGVPLSALFPVADLPWREGTDSDSKRFVRVLVRAWRHLLPLVESGALSFDDAVSTASAVLAAFPCVNGLRKGALETVLLDVFDSVFSLVPNELGSVVEDGGASFARSVSAVFPELFTGALSALSARGGWSYLVSSNDRGDFCVIRVDPGFRIDNGARLISPSGDFLLVKSARAEP